MPSAGSRSTVLIPVIILHGPEYPQAKRAIGTAALTSAGTAQVLKIKHPGDPPHLGDPRTRATRGKLQ